VSKIALVLLLLSISWSKIEIRSFVDSATVAIGDRFKYQIDVYYTDSGVVDLPMAIGNLASFEVKNFETSAVRDTTDGYVQSWVYYLSSFLTGDYIIPPQRVELTLADTTIMELSRAISLKVVSRNDATFTDILDIEEQVAPPFPWILIVIGLGLLLLILALLWIWLARQKQKKIRALNPLEIALGQLEKMETTEISDEKSQKEYAFSLSILLRTYIDALFHLETLEMTTSELKKALPKIHADEKSLSFLMEFFLKAEGVKYAREILPEESFTLWHKQAKEFVEKNYKAEEQEA
jgi:hypothetical protein